MEVDADDGRIYLPKEARDSLGERFDLIVRNDSIILVPIPDDPLKALREEWGDVDKSVEELKEEAHEAAMEIAGR